MDFYLLNSICYWRSRSSQGGRKRRARTRSRRSKSPISRRTLSALVAVEQRAFSSPCESGIADSISASVRPSGACAKALTFSGYCSCSDAARPLPPGGGLCIMQKRIGGSRMKLLRYGAVGQEKPGIIDQNGAIRDLSGVVAEIAGSALGRESLERIRALDLTALPLVQGTPRIGAPVGVVPKFLGIGLNY